MRYRRTTRALAVAGVTVILTAPMAGAHVTVDPGEAEKGGYTPLSFRVPNERDDAGTVQLEVNFPVDTPIPSVRVAPKPGWEYEVERTELDEPIELHGNEVSEVVSKVTWTGGQIAPGEFDEFRVSVGPLPEDADQILFPALQTYEGGEVVRWIEEPPTDGGEEPERPAPALTLVDAEEEGAAAADQGGLTVEDAATQDDVDGASTLGIVGIVVGVLGLVVGGLALARSRRPTAS